MIALAMARYVRRRFFSISWRDWRHAPYFPRFSPRVAFLTLRHWRGGVVYVVRLGGVRVKR